MTPHLIRVANAEELKTTEIYCRDAYEVVERDAHSVLMQRRPRTFGQHVTDFFMALIGQGAYTGPDRSGYPKAVLDIPRGTEFLQINIGDHVS